ncbi:MAG: GHKL domain-containing protein [Lachnospiraceae bacterium]|nr:GHKL domain-containing protein [Lachnospiraceae bacterium]
MNLVSFYTSLLSWFTVVPAAALCFAPMKNQMRTRPKIQVLHTSVLLFLLLIIMALLETRFSLAYNALLLPLMLVAFAFYHRSLRTPVYKSLAVFMLVFAFMSFLSNCANGYDAWLHPTYTLNDFSLQAAVFQAILTLAVAAILFLPVSRFGGYLIDHFDIPRAYYATIPVSAIFLTYNLLISPRKYETLYVNRIALVFWGFLVLFLSLLCLLCVLFYFIVSGMMEKAKTDERNRFLEMQESAYLAQQRYMEETAKVSHDFKHTISVLVELSTDGNMEAVRNYLNDYLAALPRKETAYFSENTAVNALLNYYMHLAQNNGIDLEWEIDIPKGLSVSDIDLCGILGNILENAVLACGTIENGEKYIDLAVRFEDGGILYIVATNSFDGRIRQKEGHYFSTRRSGQGMGLISIAQAAEKYGGSARFAHEGTEFYSDVVLPAGGVSSAEI